MYTKNYKTSQHNHKFPPDKIYHLTKSKNWLPTKIKVFLTPVVPIHLDVSILSAVQEKMTAHIVRTRWGTPSHTPAYNQRDIDKLDKRQINNNKNKQYYIINE